MRCGITSLAAVWWSGCNAADEIRAFTPTRQIGTVRAIDIDGQDLRLFVDRGTAAEASDYAHHIERVTGFPANGTLSQLLTFCGYDSISPRDIETLHPDELDRRLPSRTLSVRFLAPSLTDVSDAGGPAPNKDLAWRKLVRLTIDPVSPAGRRGLDGLYVLFNIFQPRREIASDPFQPCLDLRERCSSNTQVMLVPRDPGPGADAGFWLVFGPAYGDAARTNHLLAAFDGGDHAGSDAGDRRRPYYLPGACAQCHGGSGAEARLNLLDTHHWFDRVQEGEDFADLELATSNGVLFDGGRDSASARFKSVLRVVASLNRHIRDQNARVGGADFPLRAADRWLAIDDSTTAHLDQVTRALPPPAMNPAGRQWTDTPEDRRLLNALNRYCYRCHSTVAFHVFDKEAVFRRRFSMARRIELGLLRPGGMPQDRMLEPSASSEMARQLRAMK